MSNEIDADAADCQLALDADDVPYKDHLLLIDLCVDLSPATSRATSELFRRLLGLVNRRRPWLLSVPFESRFSDDVLRDIADDLREESASSSLDELRRMRRLIMRCAPGVDTAALKHRIRELAVETKSMPKKEKARQLSAKLRDLTTPYQDLLRPFEPPNKPERTADVVVWEAHRRAESRWRNISMPLLRLWGALERSGISLEDTHPDSLVTPDAVRIYWRDIHNEQQPWYDAPRLEALSSSFKRVYPDRDLTFLGELIRECRLRYPHPTRKHHADLQVRGAFSDTAVDAQVKCFRDALAKNPFKRGRNAPGAIGEFSADRAELVLRSFHEALKRNDPELRLQPDTPENLVKKVGIYMKDSLQTCAPNSVAANLTSLKSALDRIYFPCRHRFIRRRVKDLQALHQRQPIVVPEISSEELRQLGIAIAQDAKRRINDLRNCRFPYRPLSGLAERYRNGLMIVILSFLPLRLRSLTALVLGATLLKKPRVRYAISLSAKYIKTGKKFYQTLPSDICDLIDDFVEPYKDATFGGNAMSIREMIAPESTEKAIWLSRSGRALTRESIKNLVPTFLNAETGIRINCHKFRHIVATDSLDSAATDIDYGAFRLGHAGKRTIRRHYEKSGKRREIFASRSTVLDERAAQLL